MLRKEEGRAADEEPYRDSFKSLQVLRATPLASSLESCDGLKTRGGKNKLELPANLACPIPLGILTMQQHNNNGFWFKTFAYNISEIYYLNKFTTAS